MSGLLGGEVRGGWPNTDNAELCNFHSLPNIVRMITSQRMTLTGHVAYMGERHITFRL
jgi:hypothetical protein